MIAAKSVSAAGTALLVAGACMLLFAVLHLVAAGGQSALLSVAIGIADLAAGFTLALRPSAGHLRPRVLLAMSAAWGVITVAFRAYLMANGTTHWAYLAATLSWLIALVSPLSARADGRAAA